MRILLITGAFPPMKCGIGDYTAHLAGALAKQNGTKVAVLTRKEGEDGISMNNIRVFPVIQSWGFSEMVRIAQIVKNWHPDIIHFQFPSQGYRGLLPFLLPGLLSLSRAPIVQTWHEYFTKEIITCGIVSLILSPGSIIAVRPEFKAHMPSLFRWLVRRKIFRFIPSASSIPRVTMNEDERSAIRSRFMKPIKSLIVYFGFLYPHKGVDLLFKIADPAQHHVVVIGNIQDTDPYHKSLLAKMQQYPWSGNATATGFISATDVGKILTAADAVVLPFCNGGGMWNTSLHGAAIQGTFILTTSRERHGYDACENVYYARVGDIVDMRQALGMYLGHKNTEANIRQYTTWDSIAADHVSLYQSLLINQEIR